MSIVLSKNEVNQSINELVTTIKAKLKNMTLAVKVMEISISCQKYKTIFVDITVDLSKYQSNPEINDN